MLDKKHSITIPELKWFKTYSKKFKINRIIESGTYHGTSAIRLSRLFPKCKIITFEKIKRNYKRGLANCKKHKNITCVFGELDFINNDYDKKTAVLIDGPKRIRAIHLAFKLYKKVAFVGIHDMVEYVEEVERKFDNVEWCDSTHGFVIVRYNVKKKKAEN